MRQMPDIDGAALGEHQLGAHRTLGATVRHRINRKSVFESDEHSILSEASHFGESHEVTVEIDRR